MSVLKEERNEYKRYERLWKELKVLANNDDNKELLVTMNNLEEVK